MFCVGDGLARPVDTNRRPAYIIQTFGVGAVYTRTRNARPYNKYQNRLHYF